MRRSGFGTVVGLTAAVLVAAFSAQAAGAQSSAKRSPADTAGRVSADTGEAVASVAGAADHRGLHGGYYVSARQLASSPDESLGQILAMRIPGVRVVYGGQHGSEYLVSTRGEGPNALATNAGAALCYIQVFVNGSFVPDGDISWLYPTDLAGAEYYDVTRTPPAYRRPNGQCGALLVWMKDGS